MASVSIGVTVTLTLVLATWTLAIAQSDADLRAEISRLVREQFRECNIQWMSIRQYKIMNLTDNTRPYMMYYNKKTCPVCQALHRDFIEHKAIIAPLSREFLCINVMDEDMALWPEKYRPDNKSYVPAVVFADPTGQVLPSVTNPAADPETQYQYKSAKQIIAQMQAVLAMFQKSRTYPADLAKDL